MAPRHQGSKRVNDLVNRAAGWLLLALALALVGVAAAPAADSNDLSGYRLSAGDKVRIAVFGEDDLTLSERVSDRGTISYPLLGELRVADLTPGELEELVTYRLRGPYLVDPRVRVSIEEYREFFVMGQVNRPGSYAYLPGLTVRKAISIAGGFTERASRNKVFVVSERDPDEERRVKQEDEVGPGDTVVVKESFF
jgi:polysaccharide export outer membrane protein